MIERISVDKEPKKTKSVQQRVSRRLKEQWDAEYQEAVKEQEYHYPMTDFLDDKYLRRGKK